MPKGFAAAALFTLLSGATVGYYSVPSLAQQSGGANTPHDTKHADWPTAPNGTAVQPENNPRYPGDSPSRGAVTTKDDMDSESFRPTAGGKEEGGSAVVTQEPVQSDTTTTSTDTSTQSDTTVDNSTVNPSPEPSTDVAPSTTTSTSTDTSTMDNSYDQTTTTSAAPQDTTSTDTSAAPAPRRHARAHRHARME